MRRTLKDRFTEGVRLFNAGEFFEAHEAIEEVWLEIRGESRDFYRGLIQLAVAYAHYQNRNFRGCLSLLERGPRLLESYRPSYLGVDLDPLLDKVAADREYVESVAAGKAEWDALELPRIDLD